MSKLYAAATLVDPLGSVCGDHINGVLQSPAIAPLLFYMDIKTYPPDPTEYVSSKRINSARSVTIRCSTPPYEVRFKLAHSYNGSENANEWGDWILIDRDQFLQNGLSIVDIEFRNAVGTFYIEVEQ